MDDPLRVLRTIRFATRFNFQIAEEVYIAAKNPQIKEALEKKVTFERIATEMDLMLGGRAPQDAIRYMQAFKIFSHIFKVPEELAHLRSEEKVNELTD